MPFEVEHLRGLEEIRLVEKWRDEEGRLHKRGIILEIVPEDLPEVLEMQEYPRVFLSKRIIKELM